MAESQVSARRFGTGKVGGIVVCLFGRYPNPVGAGMCIRCVGVGRRGAGLCKGCVRCGMLGQEGGADGVGLFVFEGGRRPSPLCRKGGRRC